MTKANLSRFATSGLSKFNAQRSMIIKEIVLGISIEQSICESFQRAIGDGLKWIDRSLRTLQAPGIDRTCKMPQGFSQSLSLSKNWYSAGSGRKAPCSWVRLSHWWAVRTLPTSQNKSATACLRHDIACPQLFEWLMGPILAW